LRVGGGIHGNLELGVNKGGRPNEEPALLSSRPGEVWGGGGGEKGQALGGGGRKASGRPGFKGFWGKREAKKVSTRGGWVKTERGSGETYNEKNLARQKGEQKGRCSVTMKKQVIFVGLWSGKQQENQAPVEQTPGGKRVFVR